MKTLMDLSAAFTYKNNNPNCVLIIQGNKGEILTDADIPEDMRTIETIKLPAHKAFIMLNNLGLLTQCQNICKAIGQDAEITLNKAPEIHSDNQLVHMVLGKGPGGLGKSEEEIYKMFVQAEALP